MQENEAKRMCLHMILFRVTAVMLCATLISCHMVSGLWARYTTRADLSDRARVAVFSVNADRTTGETGQLTQHLTGDTSADVTTYHVVVTNHAEVAVNCTVHIQFTGAVANAFTSGLKAAGDTDFRVPSVSADQTTLSWTMDPIAAGNTATYELKLQMIPNAVAINGSDDFAFDTTVTFTQVN